jgi:hypothetical protein
LDGTRLLLANGNGDAVLIGRRRRKVVGPTMFIETTLIKPPKSPFTSFGVGSPQPPIPNARPPHRLAIAS